MSNSSVAGWSYGFNDRKLTYSGLMRVLFEELAGPQRTGGIEAATVGLLTALGRNGCTVVRRDPAGVNMGSGVMPEVVHLHGIWSPSLIRRWWEWSRRGVPCVTTVHGMLEPWALAHKRMKKRVAWLAYQKQVLNRVSLLHATSEREARNLRALALKPPIAMIPWGIEVPDAESEGRKVEGRRSEENCRGASVTVDDFPTPIHNPQATIHNPPRTALFVGRIYPVKGLPMLVDAWAKVRPSGWRVRIVGPDEAGHRAALEAMIVQAGLSEIFDFTGPLSGDELQAAYKGADLFILPSHTENFGMVVGEAMAHRLPVIATHGAPWELLETERCGWWVPVNVDGIAAALVDATRRSPEELAAMGARGREIVKERFSWDRVASEFIGCYRWLLGQGTKPGCVEIGR